MEFILKEHNFHADRIANAAIDKELQFQEVVSIYFDRSKVAWQFSPRKEPAPVSPLARILTSFSNLKLWPVSPLKEALSIKDIVTSTGIVNPLYSTLKRSTHVMISQQRNPLGNDAQTSDSDLTRMIKSLTSSTKANKFWADRMSIFDEASTSTASKEEGRLKPSWKTSENGPATASARGSKDESGEDVCDKEQEFCRHHGLGAANVEGPTAVASAVGSTVHLSEADCDCLVQAVIERLKKTRLAEN